jgi:hypothetical protein
MLLCDERGHIISACRWLPKCVLLISHATGQLKNHFFLVILHGFDVSSGR